MPKKTDNNNKHVIAPLRSNLKSCLRKRIPPPRVRALALGSGRKKKVRFSLEIVLKEQLKLLSDDSNLQ
jgi:hypothetical protein